MKKHLAMLIAFAMAFSLLAVTGAAAVDFEGDGTSDSPLRIGTAEQLVEFGARVAAGETTLCAELIADITADNWLPVGMTASGIIGGTGAPGTNSGNPYNGIFDGNGNTLTLSRKSVTTNVPVAAFGVLDVDAVVKDLKLNVDFTSFNYCAGVSAVNWGTIQDVSVEGAIAVTGVSGALFAGGIVGRNTYKSNGLLNGFNVTYGRLERCINEASVTGSAQRIGGIAGGFYGIMKYCGNRGNVTTTSTSPASGMGGGLIGGPVDTPQQGTPRVAQISDCYNAGTVIDKSGGSGSAGILGGGWDLALGYPVNANNKWRDEDYFFVKNTFTYGENLSVRKVGEEFQIATRYIVTSSGTAANPLPVDVVVDKFENIFWRRGEGAALFPSAQNYIAPDFSGNEDLKDFVLKYVKEKSADEFKSADLAAALNGDRTGDEAPWEYVKGNAYPTLKFEREAYDLTVLAGTNGSVEGDGRYAKDEEVTVEATPSAGYRFDSWETEDMDLTDEEKIANPLTFTMPANAVTLTAKFAAVGGGGGGGGTTPPGDEPPANVHAVCGSGGAITYSGGAFTVTASGGYVIDAIFVDGVPLADVQGLTTFTIEDDPEKSVFASFSPAPTTPPAGNGNGGGNGNGSEPPAGDGGSDLPAQTDSSGCDIGFGVISLLAAGAVMSIRGRKRA